MNKAKTKENHSINQANEEESANEAFETHNDPLMSIMANSQLDNIYQNTSFTQTQSESQSQISQNNTQSFDIQNGQILNQSDEDSDNEISLIRHRHLSEVTRRLTEASMQFEDPDNEGDEFYSTVWAIYTFFKHEHSFVSILNVIHQSAGDVNSAIKTLAHQPKDEINNESSLFSFKDVFGSASDIERYFSFD